MPGFLTDRCDGMTESDVKKILELLVEAYPEAQCPLRHRNPFELLIAVILSAQCTDNRVNHITHKLFSIVKTPQDIIELGEERLIELIKSCGLYRTKGRNIIETCRLLVEKHDGRVPNTMEELTSLPGVGRKTASVVLSVAFDIPAMPVDTHVFRVANRIGLANAGDVAKTEKQLMERFMRENWGRVHHLLIHHGRQVCRARNPECRKCKIKGYCDFTNQTS